MIFLINTEHKYIDAQYELFDILYGNTHAPGGVTFTVDIAHGKYIIDIAQRPALTPVQESRLMIWKIKWS